MEALYAKLYDKYTKLQKKKYSEYDEINKEQEEKFLTFVSASEELMEHLRGENQSSLEMVEKLRNEIISIRSGRDDKFLECQKLLMEEELKSKKLC
jgi:hypothetical protein